MSVVITFDMSEFDTAWERIAVPILEDGIHDAVVAAVGAGTYEALSTKRYQERTGELSGSVVGEMVGPRDGEIRAGAKHASYVNDGTGPHEIRPKEGHGLIGPLKAGQSRRKVQDRGTHRVALRWYEGGNAVFAAVVHHPGTAADGFMDRAADKAEETLTEGINDAAARVERAMR